MKKVFPKLMKNSKKNMFFPLEEKIILVICYPITSTVKIVKNQSIIMHIFKFKIKSLKLEVRNCFIIINSKVIIKF